MDALTTPSQQVPAATKTGVAHKLDDYDCDARVKRVECERDNMTLIVLFQTVLSSGQRHVEPLYISEGELATRFPGLGAAVRATLLEWFMTIYKCDPEASPFDLVGADVFNTLLLFSTDRLGLCMLPSRDWLIEALCSPDTTDGMGWYALGKEMVSTAMRTGKCPRPHMLDEFYHEGAAREGPVKNDLQAFRVVYYMDPKSGGTTMCCSGTVYTTASGMPEATMKRLDPGDRALLVLYRDCYQIVTDEFVSEECAGELDWLHSPEALKPENKEKMMRALARCALVVNHIDHSTSAIEFVAEAIRFKIWKEIINPRELEKGARADDEEARWQAWRAEHRLADEHEGVRGYALLWKINRMMRLVNRAWFFESVYACGPSNTPYVMVEATCNAPITQVLVYPAGNAVWELNYTDIPSAGVKLQAELMVAHQAAKPGSSDTAAPSTSQ